MLTWSGATAGEEATAPAILDATGVRGGLVVHVGCGDGTLTVALRASDAFLVHGLDRDRDNVAKARERIRAAGLYGQASVARWTTAPKLPYIDNLVNLVVVTGERVAREELLRVLAPEGVAYVRDGSRWTKLVKPRPGAIDEWTHYLHDATNNAVAHDTVVGPPRHLQWLGGPRYSRHHDHMSGASAMVAAGGRIFYIFDHASPMSIQLPSRWFLVARDAFNGKVLWRHPIREWHTQMFRLKSGPAQLPRRLVATRERVFVTLGLHAPVSALDPASGKTIRTYAGTRNTEELIYSDGTLFLMVNDKSPRRLGLPSRESYVYPEGPRRIAAIEADSGKVLWAGRHGDILPCTLGADARRVYLNDGERVVALDRHSGRKLWESEKLGRRKMIPSFFAPTLVVYRDVVLYSGGNGKPDERNRGGGTNTMYALSAETGKTLWTADHPPSGYKSPEDILVAGGLVWTPETTVGSLTGVMIGRDPRTGAVRKKFNPDVRTHWFHHRCHRGKATDRYILTSRTGTEFVDWQKEHWECHHWVRGACLYGVMPANGMVYNPPHPCACYLEAKLYGFNALAPDSPSRRVPGRVAAAGRLERGPAYGKAIAASSAPGDWATYRHDAARSGHTAAKVSASPSRAWERKLGGRLSAPVVAEGKLFVAQVDAHTIHALDAATGEPAWSFTAGGRIDSPPTVWEGRALFGCADGYVYCVRAQDGALVWRFRAAPTDRRHVVFEQVESAWPVHGSVLVRGDESWCVAGRSRFVDGGLRLIRLNARTGELIDEKVLDDRVPESGKNLQTIMSGLNMPVALSDILSCDGRRLYMHSQRFTLKGEAEALETPTLAPTAQKGPDAHLFCPTGFLDDIWWHRSYWVYGRVWKSGAGGYYLAGRFAPAGRPMVFDERRVYSYGRKPQYYRWTTPMEYQLYACAKQPKVITPPAPKAQPTGAAQPRRRPPRRPSGRVATDWLVEDIPVLVRAMVLADHTLFLAGPPDLVDETRTLRTFGEPATQKLLARQAAALEGAEGMVLWALSADDGKKLGETRLGSAPVFDGMIAASGRLYLATRDGRVVSLR